MSSLQQPFPADWDVTGARKRREYATRLAHKSNAALAARQWRDMHRDHVQPAEPPMKARALGGLPPDLLQHVLEQMVFDSGGCPNVIGLLHLHNTKAVCKSFKETAWAARTPFDATVKADYRRMNTHNPLTSDAAPKATMYYAMLEGDKDTHTPKGLSLGRFERAHDYKPMQIELRVARDRSTHRIYLLQVETSFRGTLVTTPASGSQPEYDTLYFYCTARFDGVSAATVLGCFSASTRPALFDYHHDFDSWTRTFCKATTGHMRIGGAGSSARTGDPLRNLGEMAMSVEQRLDSQSTTCLKGRYAVRPALFAVPGLLPLDNQPVAMLTNGLWATHRLVQLALPSSRDSNTTCGDIAEKLEEARGVLRDHSTISPTWYEPWPDRALSIETAVLASMYLGTRRQRGHHEPGCTRGTYLPTGSWLTFRSVADHEGWAAHRASATNPSTLRYTAPDAMLVPTPETLRLARGQAFLDAYAGEHGESMLMWAVDLDCTYPAASVLMGAREDHGRMGALLREELLPPSATPRGVWASDPCSATNLWMQRLLGCTQGSGQWDATLTLRDHWFELGDQIGALTREKMAADRLRRARAVAANTVGAIRPGKMTLREKLEAANNELLMLNHNYDDAAGYDQVGADHCRKRIADLQRRMAEGGADTEDEAEAAAAPAATRRLTRASTSGSGRSQRHAAAAALGDAQTHPNGRVVAASTSTGDIPDHLNDEVCDADEASDLEEGGAGDVEYHPDDGDFVLGRSSGRARGKRRADAPARKRSSAPKAAKTAAPPPPPPTVVLSSDEDSDDDSWYWELLPSERLG